MKRILLSLLLLGASPALAQISNPGVPVIGLPVIGGAASKVLGEDANQKLATYSISGNTTTVATVSGSLTSGNCVKSDASGNFVDAATTCGGGASGITVGTTTITSGTTLRLLYDNAGVVGETSGITFAGTGQLAVATGTITTSSQPAIAISQTWNDAAVLFIGASFDYTLTAKANNSTGVRIGSAVTNASNLYQALSITAAGSNDANLVIQGGSGQKARILLQDNGSTSARLDINTRNIADGNATAAGVISANATLFAVGSSDTSPVRFVYNSIALLTFNAAATVQYGPPDAAAPVAQSARFQSVIAGTSNTAGALATFKDSAGTGTGISGGYSFQVAPAGSTGTSQNTYSAAMTIAGGTGLFALPLITSDATHTDSSICQDTTTHALYSGSGTLGVCLGTSGRQFKTALVPMKAGLDEIAKIKLWNYRYKDGFGDSGKRIQFGPTAQDVEEVIPELAGHDAEGNTINYDIGAFIPITMHAIQQLKKEIDALKAAR